MLYLSPVIVRLLNRFRPLSGSYISQYPTEVASQWVYGFRPLSGSYISQSYGVTNTPADIVSVPYRGATFLNKVAEKHGRQQP